MFDDTTIAEAILLTDNPREQKDLGRMVHNYDDTVWASRRVEIMIAGLYEKFSQNPKLRDALLATKDTELVEASPYDLIWGIGYTSDNPSALDKAKWRGQNLLGVTLMAVRDKLHEQYE